MACFTIDRVLTELSPLTSATVQPREGEAPAIPTYPVTLLWYPRMEKQALRVTAGMPKVIIFNDDEYDLVSVSELFARADPDPAQRQQLSRTTGTHKQQI